MNLDFVTLNYSPSITETSFTVSYHIGNYKVDMKIPHGISAKELSKIVKKAAKDIKSIHCNDPQSGE
jgi:hypothetical protein